MDVRAIADQHIAWRFMKNLLKILIITY